MNLIKFIAADLLFRVIANSKPVIIALGVVFTYIGDNIAYQHGLHFCREVYPYRNQNKV
jgi:hypothetical protein